MTDETTEQIELSAQTLEQMSDREILLALLKGFGKIEKRLDAHVTQLEAIREGIVMNASRFDRLEANIYAVRSDISNFKADIRDLREEARKNSIKILS